MEQSIRKDISKIITTDKERLASQIMQIHLQLSPQMAAGYSQRQKDLCHQDVIYNLSYLAQSIEFGSTRLFEVYAQWLYRLLKGLGIKEPDLITSFSIMQDQVCRLLSPEQTEIVKQHIKAALRAFEQQIEPDESEILPANPKSSIAKQFLDLILQGNRHEASELILSLAKDKESLKSIYLDILQPVQREIGRLWQTGRITVAQEHYCTGITQMVISQLYPYIFMDTDKTHTLVATCVSGELHEIGLRMLSDIFELEGWNTWYLGANMPEASIIDTIIEKDADLIAISATMTFHLGLVSSLIDQIRAKGIKTPIIVGGYPFIVDQSLWQRLGADGSAGDALQALTLAEKLVAG